MVYLANITHRDPDILSGSLVFVGTRVPVRSLMSPVGRQESAATITDINLAVGH